MIRFRSTCPSGAVAVIVLMLGLMVAPVETVDGTVFTLGWSPSSDLD
jgi:hypothetical protein